MSYDAWKTTEPDLDLDLAPADVEGECETGDLTDLTDGQLEEIRDRAAAREDFDTFDDCETALKMIVQPNLRRAAIERINARSAK